MKDYYESAGIVPCPDCGGTGYLVDGSECERCGGWGEIEEPDTDKEDYVNYD
jgi:DnaJ-class molecular chaperone